MKELGQEVPTSEKMNEKVEVWIKLLQSFLKFLKNLYKYGNCLQ